MKLLVVILALACVIPAYAGELSVTKAYYRDTNASLHLIMANKGNAPVTVLPPVVNGFDTAGLRKGLRKTDPVLWYRCTPSSVPAHGMADLTIVLAGRSDKTASVELTASNGQRITCKVPCRPEAFRFQAIRFDPDLRTIHVYARWSDPAAVDALASLHMDGRSLAKYAALPAHSADGLAYACVKLPAPLDRCSFHVFEAETVKGLSTGYAIRAIPAEFLIGVYGSPSAANDKDWAAHGCNHYVGFRSVSPDTLNALGAVGIRVGAKYISEDLVDRPAGKVLHFDPENARKALAEVSSNQSLLYHELVDEPDAADYYVDKTLGASSMELAARYEFYEREDPSRYTFVQLDNTFRPKSYCVYGESADVIATHRYSLGNLIHGEADVRTQSQTPFLNDLVETTSLLRRSTEPRPFFMVTQFFDLGAGRSGRAPTVDEMRIQCYAMVANGARGMIHYIHSGSGGGHEGGRTPALWDGMTALHAELMRLADVASVGTPAPASWCKSDSASVLSSLVVGGNRMAVILINRKHQSAMDSFVAVPVTGVKVSVRVPSWIRTKSFRVIAVDSRKPVSARVSEGVLSFTVDSIGVASGFVIQPED